MFFSPFSIAITSLGEERANLSAFRTFVRFVLVWSCWFPLPLGVCEGLRFVIVALPGLFSYLFRAFHTFVRFVLVWFCWFPLPLGIWEGLRFVIVALPAFLSYLFYMELLIIIFSLITLELDFLQLNLLYLKNIRVRIKETVYILIFRSAMPKAASATNIQFVG